MASTVYKPPGVPVFPPHARPDGDCVLARWLHAEPARRSMAWPAGFEGGIAHRLDVSTSGALWVADSLEELSAMRASFADKRLTKRYVLRVARSPDWDVNRNERRIAHDRRKKSKMVVERGQNTPHRGRWYDADTRFERVSGVTFRAVMHTGVMHQIRVHAAFLGIPLAGDRRYGGGETPSDAPEGAVFLLHHEGLTTADGWGTTAVPAPAWVSVG